ncbi:MFS transporter [Actinokineospora terrae]|uniref:Major Facilitator Superfamily protein n=1 Tax=Actinokineospora terrae TaxID=155974 RepID=A0A1H9V6A1_9PSEU|nr:MFS transporter [Actinokineospora terrae]SES16767.1 Major Facilitator Superfamily protein [Actinokineospora terrae]
MAFGFATAAVFVGWYGPLQVLLARQAEGVDGAGKEAVLALVAAAGALGSMVANPVWGALSDRSGRRLPWVLGGAVAGAGGLVLLGTATSTAGMVAGWVGVQVALNAPFAALSAVIPDQVPENRRGTVGGWFGLAQTVGIMAGTGLALVGGTVLSGYLACAAAVALGVVPFTILAKEKVPSRQSTKVKKTPDFRWAWVTRFLINLGNAIALLYLLYYLKDEVRVADPDAGVFLLTAIYAVALLSTVVAGGALSDRLGRRRVFVCAAGLVMAVAAVLLAVWSTWTGAITAAVVLGVGFGAYTSVDFALVTEVLPTAADRGKDLGVINVANTLPQVLAPVVAAPLVALGGYPVLYMVAAVVGVAGSVLVFRIKTVR